MLTINVTTQPELHVDPSSPVGEFTIAVGLTVRLDGLDIPGFQATVLVPPALLAELIEQPDEKAALAFVLEQIGVVDERYSLERIQKAAEAFVLAQTLAAYLPTLSEIQLDPPGPPLIWKEKQSIR